MIEIIILVFLSIKIGKMAKKKSLKRNTWILYTVLSWIGGEIIGVIVGFAIFDKTNIISIMLMGIAGAIGGYFIIKQIIFNFLFFSIFSNTGNFNLS